MTMREMMPLYKCIDINGLLLRQFSWQVCLFYSILLHINEVRNASLLKILIHKTDTSWHPKGGFMNLSEFCFGLSPSAISYQHIFPPNALVSKAITALPMCLLLYKYWKNLEISLIFSCQFSIANQSQNIVHICI